jgi:hypothetical protein
LPESPRPTGEVITRLDSFLRALDVRLLLILKADADSPRVLDLLTCYAHDFKALAAADGDSFDHEIKLLVDALTKQAKLPSRTRAKDIEAIGRHIRNLRSSCVTILAKPVDPDHAELDSASDDDKVVDFDLDATNLCDVLQAVADTMGPGRRVCRSAPCSASRHHAVGLSAASGLAALASVDDCCQAVESGFLNDPTNEAALALFGYFADYIRGKMATVHDTFYQHTTTLCNDLNVHASTAAAIHLTTTKMKTCNAVLAP